jgi:gas vesicle protein
LRSDGEIDISGSVVFFYSVFKGWIMKAFLVGLGIGVGLGVLFAPDSGEETRREIGDRLNDFAADARRQAGDVANQVRDNVRTVKEAVTEPSARSQSE